MLLGRPFPPAISPPLLRGLIFPRPPPCPAKKLLQPGNSDSYPDGTTATNINSSATLEKRSSINGKHDGADGGNNECCQSSNGSQKRKKREASKGVSSSRRHFRNHIRTIAIDGDTGPATTTNKCDKDDNNHLDNGQFTSTDDFSNWSTIKQLYNTTPNPSSKTALQSNNNSAKHALRLACQPHRPPSNPQQKHQHSIDTPTSYARIEILDYYLMRHLKRRWS